MVSFTSSSKLPRFCFIIYIINLFVVAYKRYKFNIMNYIKYRMLCLNCYYHYSRLCHPGLGLTTGSTPHDHFHRFLCSKDQNLLHFLWMGSFPMIRLTAPASCVIRDFLYVKMCNCSRFYNDSWYGSVKWSPTLKTILGSVHFRVETVFTQYRSYLSTDFVHIWNIISCRSSPKHEVCHST